MTGAGAFSNLEVATAGAVALVVEVGLFLLLAFAPNTARIEAKEQVAPKEIPIAVQPILDLPLLKKGGKQVKAKLPDMWVPKQPVKRYAARSAPSPMAEDNPLEKPIEAPLAKLDETPPPPEAEVAKEVDEQVKEIEDDTKAVEEPNLPQEGAADGVKEGTETDPLKAFVMSQYKARIAAWFQARFKPPDDVPCEDLKKLRASIVASVSQSRTVTSFSVVRPSGNGAFDGRVQSMMSSIQSQQSELPPPPPKYPDILGTTINVTLYVPSCD
jgi:hypothetical protein